MRFRVLIAGLAWSLAAGAGCTAAPEPVEDDSGGEGTDAEPGRPGDGRFSCPTGATAEGDGGEGAEASAWWGGAGEVPRQPGGPRSLAGTEVDGALRAGPDGHLVVDADVVRFFDYFLAASGEEPLAAASARVHAAVRARLTGVSRDEALALFERLLDYRAAGRALTERGVAGDLEARFAAVRALRRDHFGAAADRLFASEEQTTALDLQRRRLLLEAVPSPARAARLRALDAGLPLDVRGARDASAAPVHALLEEDALRRAGASPGAIHAARVERFGAAAAERLRTLDQERAAWAARVDAFRAARARLARESASDEARLSTAETALLEARFAPAERLRLRAILLSRAPNGFSR